ncbi:hypothetical protein LTR62_001016 [Meristemomyces frigidus]|uniref:NADH-ubiquinone oxidoreductase n=1 Tax=Meristemomyces frigidus TaxID=1508187 RepID=A0AAN7T9Q1_9PEZI|nr:hypothetical protein LTR62_001016 [Meristemomyces frigidus]
MSARQPRFNQHLLIDTTPLPSSIPSVPEIGSSSAPLLSASYFIGARCKPYNDDFMQCKTDANGTGETDCLREGRKVTRCAASVLEDVNKSCLEEFRQHWSCLDDNNQQLWQCRRWERPLNKCVFEKLNIEKKIPGAPENEVQVHLRKRQIFAHSMTTQ